MDKYSKEKRSEIMKKIKSKDTVPEKKVRSFLHSLGYRFRLHKNDLPGRPDIVLPKYKTVIFVHGCFWHGHECKAGQNKPRNSSYWTNKLALNAERDKKNIQDITSLGWKVIIIWECQVKDIESLGKILTKLLTE